jgi:glycosyltransferase involved in cell wall biosynthesis
VPRTLFVTNLVTHYRLPLFQRLAALMDVQFVAFSDGGEWYWQGADAGADGLRVRRLRGRWLGRTRVTPGLAPIVLREPFDVCVAGLIGRFALPICFLGARLRGKGFVLWTGLWRHPTTGVHRYTQGITRYVYRRADAVVTYGSHVSATVLAAGADPTRVFIAPQAVDLERFTSTGRGSGARHLRIGYVGRLELWKGPLVLLDALAVLDKAGIEFSAVIAGGGGLEATCRERIGDLGLQDRVTLAGQIENNELPELYRELDVLVIPSVETAEFSEPWSLAVNEAMGCGVTVIASDGVGAVADGLVAHRHTGLVFPQGDADALAAMLRDVATDGELLSQLAAAGHRAVQAYSYEAAASAFVAAIEVAAKRARGAA